MSADSFLQPPEDGQPGLPGLPARPVFAPLSAIEASLEPEGEFTGERLFAQKPEVYRGVVALLARGWGAQKIADTLFVSKNTVKAVRAREGLTVEQVKERIAAESFDLAADAFEGAKLIVEEVLGDRERRAELTVKDAKDLAIVAGVAVQNAQLLSGAPTSRVAVTELPTPEHDAFNQYLEGLKKLPPAIDPPQTPDPAAMGFAGGTLGQKEGAVDRARLVADATAATGPGAGTSDVRSVAESDVQSEGQDNKTQ